jgi:uncharacterized protein with HEPN domain
MPSSNPGLRLRDIVAAIDEIHEYTADIADAATFGRQRQTKRAVERCFQIISEAAIKLADDAERLCPGLPWADIRGIGNPLRHEYDRVIPERLWMARDDLPALRTACIEALRTHFGEDL